MKCRICGKELKFISYHHLQKHNMTAKEYKERFNVDKLADIEVRQKMAKKKLGNKNCKGIKGDNNPAKRPEVRKKISESKKGDKNPMRRPEVVKKQVEAVRGKRKGGNNPFYGRHHTRETKHYLSEGMKNKWNDPDYIRKQMEARNVKPNRHELKLLSVLKTVSLDWRYVGDGRLLIGGKSPDFWDGRNKLIEYFGDYWHEMGEEKPRIEHFAKYGYNCLVIWEHELDKEEKVMSAVFNLGQDGIGGP